ncbi:prolyl oligopeptidase [Aquimarina sp. AD10]|uniref:prolyl oligopeptidase family serine peptidase n=1 Tax=Aquimarina sp. AD10 TaxID=1714849 RepID=UPI000E4F9449|nr:prolyl oligopeptidase family serine peptidase [Aquimarina sp. AD10]AXT62177.1 prolyl oligopeptidase [Aquimarina sp. AD10]RKM90628.1 prolyl oligopeptidase [Aquimarina sp. AD10]
MLKRIFFILSLASCSSQVNKPPLAESIKTVDLYHGKELEDPYRNLENLEDSLVVDWLKKQGDFAFETLNKIQGKQRLIDLQKGYGKEKSYFIRSVKNTSNGKYFYLKTIAGDDIAKLYFRTSIDGKEVLLFDPVQFELGSDSTYIINYIKPDWEGEKIAVSLSKQGDEISKVITIDVFSKKVLSGIVKNCNPNFGGIQWLPDNSGFIYQFFPKVDPKDPSYGLHTKAILYSIGENADELHEVFSKSNNPNLKLKDEDFPIVQVYTDSDQYVFGKVSGASSFKDMYYKKHEDLLLNQSEWKLLYRESDMVNKIILDDQDLIFLSAKNASNFQICKTSILQPNFKSPQVLVSEDKDAVVSDVEITKDGIFYVCVKNGVEAKLYHYRNGVSKELKLPIPSGNIQISSKGSKYDYLKITCTGWTKSPTSYLYNFKTNKYKQTNLNLTIEYPAFENLEVKEVEVPSHDGVLIPLSIIYKKGIKKNGKNPTLFFSYGSYGGALNPFFDSSFLTWVTEGGVLAIAHVRGGGEKGEAWHKAGFKTTKPNTWKDMIACTEHMIQKGYTKPEKSAIWGTSAGGIMAGRAITERPDLYAAAVLYSPSLNLVRSEIQPNGLNSVKEFGTVKIKEEFEALLEMDSYHHIKENTSYPATLIAAGVKDGRVVVWDPAKFAARLQASNSSDNPILFAVDFESGHGGMNNGALKVYEQFANTLSFAFWQTGHPDYQPE